MENDFWNNPGLKNMSPEKLQFLMNFASKEKPTNIKDMMPFLLGTMNAAKQIISSSQTPKQSCLSPC